MSVSYTHLDVYKRQLVSRVYKRAFSEKLDFEPEEEKLLCEYVKKTTGSDFVFVTHYPSAKRPFYAMDSRENPAETESFDLLFRGLEAVSYTHLTPETVFAAIKAADAYGRYYLDEEE